MTAYMKGIAPFLGITAPTRRSATRAWLRQFDPGPGAGALLAAARELSGAPEREFAYVAIDLAARYRHALPATSLAELRELALTRPWWDTVDAWASVIGRAAIEHTPGHRPNHHDLSRAERPEAVGWDPTVAAWATDPQLWARRIALVFQVGRGPDADLDLLFSACRSNLGDRDFFIRKGIGWALRDAARSHPDAVTAFVRAHRDELSTLSFREATKHLSID